MSRVRERVVPLAVVPRAGVARAGVARVVPLAVVPRAGVARVVPRAGVARVVPLAVVPRAVVPRAGVACQVVVQQGRCGRIGSVLWCRVCSGREYRLLAAQGFVLVGERLAVQVLHQRWVGVVQRG